MPIAITTPGSKSIANRALILKTLTGNKTRLKNLPASDDTHLLIEGIKKLTSKNPKIYTGNAGTTTRFLTALATLYGKKIIIAGDKRMNERPIGTLASALNQLGAKVKTSNGFTPVTIYPQIPTGGKIKLPGNISSQFLSAILMIAPFLKSRTIINIEQKLYSQPYIDTTIRVMASFGLKVMNKNFRQFVVNPQKTKPPKTYTVESDASSASYIGAYAALHPGKKILLKNIYKNSIQGDIKFLHYLAKMGCKTTASKNGTLIKGPQKLKCLGKVNMNQTPDLVMTFAVLALFTPGTTTITNIGNLRIKETDRIAALKSELQKLGAKVKTCKDFIKIKSATINPEKQVTIETYNDHRIAMSFGILTDIFRNMKIKTRDCVSKSYTTFWSDLKKITAS